MCSTRVAAPVALVSMCTLPHGRAVKVDQKPLVRVEVERICKLEEKKTLLRIIHSLVYGGTRTRLNPVTLTD